MSYIIAAVEKTKFIRGTLAGFIALVIGVSQIQSWIRRFTFNIWALNMVFCSLRVVECDQVSEGHLVDALALRGDEGRDRLR